MRSACLVLLLVLAIAVMSLSTVHAWRPVAFSDSIPGVDLSQYHIRHVVYGDFEIPQSNCPCYIVLFYSKYEHTCRWYIASQYLPPEDTWIGRITVYSKDGNKVDREFLGAYSNVSEVEVCHKGHCAYLKFRYWRIDPSDFPLPSALLPLFYETDSWSSYVEVYYSLPQRFQVGHVFSIIARVYSTWNRTFIKVEPIFENGRLSKPRVEVKVRQDRWHELRSFYLRIGDLEITKPEVYNILESDLRKLEPEIELHLRYRVYIVRGWLGVV